MVKVGDRGFGRAQIILRGEQDLRSALAGGDRDEVEELDGLVGKNREILLCAEDGDASADVAGERLHIFERDHLGFARSGGAGKLLEIQLRVSGDDGKGVLLRAGDGEQRLEYLLDRQPDLARHVDGGEVFGVDLVLLQRVSDAQAFEDAGCVGLHRGRDPWWSQSARPASIVRR